jgi:hypothetical protein
MAKYSEKSRKKLLCFFGVVIPEPRPGWLIRVIGRVLGKALLPAMQARERQISRGWSKVAAALNGRKREEIWSTLGKPCCRAVWYKPLFPEAEEVEAAISTGPVTDESAMLLRHWVMTGRLEVEGLSDRAKQDIGDALALIPPKWDSDCNDAEYFEWWTCWIWVTYQDDVVKHIYRLPYYSNWAFAVLESADCQGEQIAEKRLELMAG